MFRSFISQYIIPSMLKYELSDAIKNSKKLSIIETNRVDNVSKFFNLYIKINDSDIPDEVNFKKLTLLTNLTQYNCKFNDSTNFSNLSRECLIAQDVARNKYILFNDIVINYYKYNSSTDSIQTYQKISKRFDDQQKRCCILFNLLKYIS